MTTDNSKVTCSLCNRVVLKSMFEKHEQTKIHRMYKREFTRIHGFEFVNAPKTRGGDNVTKLLLLIILAILITDGSAARSCNVWKEQVMVVYDWVCDWLCNLNIIESLNSLNINSTYLNLNLNVNVCDTFYSMFSLASLYELGVRVKYAYNIVRYGLKIVDITTTSSKPN